MLDQTSSRPLYEQLKQALMGEIMAGTYSCGQRLPGENDLAEQYGISRITVRRAVSELVKEGFLASQQGKGTFVSFRKDEQQLRSFGGFSESFNDGTKMKSSRILRKSVIEADPLLSEKLKVPEGERIVYLNRVMYENSNPYMLDHAYFIERMYPGIFDLLKENMSTFVLLWNHYHKVFITADKTIGAVRAGMDEALLLNCVPGDPLLAITKVIYDRDEVPLHYSHYYVKADRCIYTLRITGMQSDMELHYQG